MGLIEALRMKNGERVVIGKWQQCPGLSTDLWEKSGEEDG
jgi:hypothetical protein